MSPLRSCYQRLAILPYRQLSSNSATATYKLGAAIRCQRMAAAAAAAVPATHDCQLPKPLTAGSLVALKQAPLLMVSDIDDTMAGHEYHDSHTAAFREFWDFNRRMGRQCFMVLNTGRTLPLYHLIAKEKAHCLVEPDYLVAGVGTRIYRKGCEGWEEDLAWTAHIGHNWDHSLVVSVLCKINAELGPQRMGFQHALELHEHKLTVRVAAPDLEYVVATLHQQLNGDGIDFRTVIGGEDQWRYIDLLPLRAGKANATAYLQRKLGLQPEHVVVAGDSNNDLDMLQMAHHSIVVGNCIPSVRQWALQTLASRQQPENLASDPPQHLHLAQGHVAAGLLEGLTHFGFI